MFFHSIVKKKQLGHCLKLLGVVLFCGVSSAIGCQKLKWTMSESLLGSVRSEYMATGVTANALGEEWKVVSSGSVWE